MAGRSESPSALSANGQRPDGDEWDEFYHLIESLSADSVESSDTKDEDSDSLYLIISSRDGLITRYGQLGFNQLDKDLRELKEAVESHAGLGTMMVYVDDESSLAPYGLQPVDSINPEQIKTLIDSLDIRLAERGQEIRYVLIVGGDSVIPFHRLPNPIDDQDADVLSDNPYASRSANYLIPERAVGRMPDGEGEGIGLLHTLINTAVAGHQEAAASKKGAWGTVCAALRPTAQAELDGHSLGYSASIWRGASRDVFQVIGGDRQLRTSPPLTYQEFQIVENLSFSYFNLHGTEDSANWYGQRDPLFPADYPVFPVALRPQDLAAAECANSIVFSEACYGADILGKDSAGSIALRFLASEALAMIGSTRASYGAIDPPLLAADLVGKYFWEGVRAHLTLGEALKHAKVSLAQEMEDRQGYLDGEDQKALISFVLYGDPSLPVAAVRDGGATGISSATLCPPIICHKRAARRKTLMSDEMVAKIKDRIEISLPYMAEARMHVTPLTPCDGGCSKRCAFPHGAVRGPQAHSRNWALTLEKNIPVEDDDMHRQTVRVTVDEEGHVLKMAISK